MGTTYCGEATAKACNHRGGDQGKALAKGGGEDVMW